MKPSLETEFIRRPTDDFGSLPGGDIFSFWLSLLNTWTGGFQGRRLWCIGANASNRAARMFLPRYEDFIEVHDAALADLHDID